MGGADELELAALAGPFVVIGSAFVVVVVVVVVIFVSFGFVVELLLLLFELFACVNVPFITFRGNGFGLIISTEEEINHIS